MRVIITGATGCIGRNLAEGLHDDGIDVRATGRSAQIGQELHAKGIDFRAADLLDADRLTDAFASADCVVHCAGKSADWGTASDFFDVNVVGTRNVVSACEHHGIRRILFIATPSMYFTGNDRFDITEAEPLPERQLTHYAKTKLIAEKELLALGRRGYHVIVLRPRAVYGPHDRTLVPRILRLAEKRRFPLINGGQALTDITWVGNFVDAVQLASMHLSTPGTSCTTSPTESRYASGTGSRACSSSSTGPSRPGTCRCERPSCSPERWRWPAGSHSARRNPRSHASRSATWRGR